MWKRKFRGARTDRPGRKRPSRQSHSVDLTGLEHLDPRVLPVVSASFSAGVLTVVGDNLNNSISVSRNVAGRLFVNGGAISIRGAVPTVVNTKLIQISGQGGNDTLSLNETNGPLPKAKISGGTGNDKITGGSGADLLMGDAGNDTIFGKGGADQLFGAAGNDILTGGTGNDQVLGQADSDRMIWNNGDGSDLNEGGTGNDTTEVNGSNGDESFAITANGARVKFERTTAVAFTLDIGSTENLVLNANGGNDNVDAGAGLAPLIKLTVDGGTGNDTIQGGDGVDTLSGGEGNDFIDGGKGNDVIFLGAGDDTFRWDPGDGNDTVDGDAGADTMLFNGANVDEQINITANGPRVTFARDVANVVIDLGTVEGITFNALGGLDTIHVGDTTGTSLTHVDLDLSGVAGTDTGDTSADSVVVDGTNNADNVNITGAGKDVTVAGVPATVAIKGSDGITDGLTVNTLGGDDNVDAGTLPATIIKLTVDAGAGNDFIQGGDGVDTLSGGEGNDFIDGGKGNDTAILGAGDDTFRWDPGDGNDIVEGQAGVDKLLFNGANAAAENIDISANGTRVKFFRDVANVTIDMDDTEIIDFNALGGVDNVVVNDTTGTDLTQVNVNLNSAGGGGDGAADSVTVNGTNNDDNIQIATANGTGVAVTGLPAQVNITGSEGALDRLIVASQGGNDTVNAANLTANLIGLTESGGAGNDTFTGSQGNDTVIGGTGNDTANLGAGDDTFIWNPGDGSDVVQGQAGNDRLLFNGAAADENINISANAGHAIFFRNVGNVTIDLDDVEAIDFNALGGIDNITVNDLTGTDVTAVNLDLATPAGSGAGDGAVDSVDIKGTNGADAITVTGDATGVDVSGLHAKVTIKGAEAANDRLTIDALDGDDVVDAAGLAAGAIPLTVNGGNNNDILIGGAGNDTLNGEAGDDFLFGRGGADTLDGGTGTNTLVQD